MLEAYWLAPALWYGSLVLSILGILLSAQQIAVLHLLEAGHSHGDTSSAKAYVNRYLPLMLTEIRQQRFEVEEQMDGCVTMKEWKPRWKMVFTWQCPMMFTSYSVCFFLSGLTIYVCTPLIRKEEWNTSSNVVVPRFPLRSKIIFDQLYWRFEKIAMLYLAVAAIAGGAFLFCSFWVYHYVDLDYDTETDIPT